MGVKFGERYYTKPLLTNNKKNKQESKQTKYPETLGTYQLQMNEDSITFDCRGLSVSDLFPRTWTPWILLLEITVLAIFL